MARLRIFDYANYVSGLAIDLLPNWPNFSNATLVSVSPTQVILALADGTRTVLTGTGLTFNGNVPTAGTLETIARTDTSGATILALMDQISIPLRNVVSGAAAGISSTTAFVITGDDQFEGAAGGDRFAGSNGNDVLAGNAGNDSLSGDNGNDTLLGGKGNDTLTPHSATGAGATEADLVDGGAGRDTLEFRLASTTEGIVLDFRLAETSAGLTLPSGTVVRNVEQFHVRTAFGADVIIGGQRDDELAGSAGADTLEGRAGNDELIGGEGSDTLRGGAGDDRLIPREPADAGNEAPTTDTVVGGDGLDRVQLTLSSVFFSDAPVVVDFSGVQFDAPSATFNVTPNLQVVYSEIEGVIARGASGADHITGSSGHDDLGGSAGADTISGGEGDDLIDPGASASTFPESTTAIVETLDGGGGTDTLRLSLGNKSDVAPVLDFSGISSSAIVSMAIRPTYTINVSNFEAVHVLVGDLATAFTITGLPGDDVIAGGSHSDVINGLGGDDILFGEESQFFATSTDVLRGGEGDDLLVGLVADDFLEGGDGEDVALFFGRRADYAVIERGDGSFNVVGQGTLLDMGSDSLHDIEIARFVSDPSQLAAVSARAQFSGGEIVILSAAGRVVEGSSDDDTIVSLRGNDVLTGLEGDDTLDGGAGDDSAAFLSPHRYYQIHTKSIGGIATTSVTDAVGAEGTDTITGVETLRFADGPATRFGAQQNLTSNVDGLLCDDVVYRSVLTGQVIFQDMLFGVTGGFNALTAPLASEWTAIGTGDVTGDGRADVFIWNSTNGFVYSALPGASAAPTYGMVAGGITGTYSALGATDVNGDGYADLLVREANSGSIFWQDTTTSAWDYVAINLGSNWRYQAAGDVNRDGLADVVLQDVAGNVYVADMAGGRNSGYIDLGNVAGYQVRAVADVNADGYADVIVQSESDGWTLWRDLSGNGPAWNAASDPVGTAWIVQDAADVDNDGSADLIYQHSTTGETLYRNMDGGVGVDWGVVSSPLGTEWVVV